MERKQKDITLERIISLIPQNKNGRFERGEAAKFSEKIGIAENLPAEWKAGRNKSYNKYLYQISDKYNVSVEWLKGETDVKEKPAPKNGDEFWELYIKLDPKKKQLIQNMIEQLSGEK